MHRVGGVIVDRKAAHLHLRLRYARRYPGQDSSMLQIGVGEHRVNDHQVKEVRAQLEGRSDPLPACSQQIRKIIAAVSEGRLPIRHLQRDAASPTINNEADLMRVSSSVTVLHLIQAQTRVRLKA